MAGPGDDGPLGFGDEDDRPGKDAGRTGESAREEAEADRPARDRYAHRRDPDLAAYGMGPGADPDARPPGVPRSQPINTSRYTWFVGVVAVLLIAVVTVNSITSDGPGSRGVAVGRTAPPFAAPLVENGFAGDRDYVNVATRSGQKGDAGKVAACSIHRPDTLTICDLYREKPVVLAFFFTRGDSCGGQLAELQRLAAGRTDVAFAAVALKAKREDAADVARTRGVRFPVAYDRDGILSTLYNVVICPEISFIRKGGRVAGTSFGEKTAAELRPLIDALAAGRALPEQRK